MVNERSAGSRRVGVVLLVAALALLLGSSLATAATNVTPTPSTSTSVPPKPMKCSVELNGNLPTCHLNKKGRWVAVYPEGSFDNGGFPDDGSGGGFPAGFIVLFVIVGILGVGTTIWKVTAARQLATNSGMNPNTAAAMTLLTNDGLDATYLASSLRGTVSPPRRLARRVVQLPNGSRS